MVFRLTGSDCEGYAQKVRKVTRITDGENKVSMLDVRSNTWEKGNGQVFRFTSRQIANGKEEEFVSGLARRKGRHAGLVVKIKSPEPVTLNLPDDVMFPTQHSLALLRAAKAGKSHLAVRVFDGSEQGQGYYTTYSFIGHKIPVSGGKGGRLAPPGLAGLASWPVAISYFKQQIGHYDEVPVYELSFRLFENGVSGDLLMNYGSYRVRGRLARLDYLRPHRCHRR